MIEPTVGRVVWFYKHVPGQGHKGPMAALIAHTFMGNARVNLMVIDTEGTSRGVQQVMLIQDGDSPECDFCTWMPFQKGQAIQSRTPVYDAAEKKD